MREITEEAKERADALRDVIVVTKNQITDLQNQAKGLEQEIARLLCPWQVGDTVLHNKTTMKGVAHKRGIVGSVKMCAGGYQVWVRYFKKDGSLSTQESRVWDDKRLSLDKG